MNIRHASALVFLTACGSTVTQDPPQDPVSIQDAGIDADAMTTLDASDVAIGRACTTDADCGGGEVRCKTTMPGGYCTFMCGGTMECPEGSVCSPVPLSRIAGECMQTCTSNTDCREGYVCGLVYLFPGQADSPVSPSTVCWTPPPNP